MLVLSAYPFTYVDYREHAIIEDIKDMGVPFATRENWFGDFEPVKEQLDPEFREDEEIIAVGERKTVHDAYNSLLSGHLDEQMEKMARECFDRQIPLFLIISGKWKDYEAYQKRRRRLIPNKKSFEGMIASCIVRYGASFIWLEDTKSMLEVIFKVFRKINEGKLYKQKKIILKNHYGYPPQVVRIQKILGISYNISQRLFDTFGSVRGVFLADVRDILAVQGVGEKTLKRIQKVLD
jgi:ERCC4-type nuclease